VEVSRCLRATARIPGSRRESRDVASGSREVGSFSLDAGRHPGIRRVFRGGQPDVSGRRPKSREVGVNPGTLPRAQGRLARSPWTSAGIQGFGALSVEVSPMSPGGGPHPGMSARIPGRCLGLRGGWLVLPGCRPASRDSGAFFRRGQPDVSGGGSPSRESARIPGGCLGLCGGWLILPGHRPASRDSARFRGGEPDVSGRRPVFPGGGVTPGRLPRGLERRAVFPGGRPVVFRFSTFSAATGRGPGTQGIVRLFSGRFRQPARCLHQLKELGAVSLGIASD
jgi:hypothetical protein